MAQNTGWTIIENELCAALIQTCPRIYWQTTLDVDATGFVSGVVVYARHGPNAIDISISRKLVLRTWAPGLIDEIINAAEKLLDVGSAGE